jgi:hypothetical protein
MLALANNLKVFDGSATVGAQIAVATNLPASGSFIDVSTGKWVHVLCRLGVVHASDLPTLEPRCSDAVGGTLDAIDASLVHSVAADDDEEWVTWSIEVESLPLDHHFMSVLVGGTVTNGSFAQVFFLLDENDKPVTQTTAVLPTTSKYVYGAGQVVTG